MKEQGIGKLTALVFGLITAVIVYSAYSIAPFFYYYYEIQNQMEQVIRVASTHNDQEIREKLLYHIKKAELPAAADDLKIERIGQRMRISLPYKEVFYVTWKGKDYDIYTFRFHAFAEGEF